MFLSVFDIFKIGIGPSSSHTMGPMIAAARFLDLLRSGAALVPGAGTASQITCTLHGSLAFTGKGHATDKAVFYGLLGFVPETFDLDLATRAESAAAQRKQLEVEGIGTLDFDPDVSITFDYGPSLPQHTNGLVFRAFDDGGNLHAEETYFSIGGGFVVTAKELENPPPQTTAADVPYPFHSAEEMLAMAKGSGLTIAGMKRSNEIAQGHGQKLDKGVLQIWKVMAGSIDAGLQADGVLPGGLQLRRRAKALQESLRIDHGMNLAAPHTINDWIASYAIAVNEVNAAGGQIVTAPTNGASGVVPATLRYYLDHVPNASQDRIVDFLLTAAAIGGLLKANASISGAEVGCQGEVGSAAAMAAAGLCAVLGGSPEQVENAAEIALEHHLGMTCDPIKGLVQAPCIERNGLGAIKAVSAASLALRGDGTHLVSLDACIETMRQTGRDMNEKYKETSLGGLAVNVPNC
ncbi:L-serine ammonia-lyase [Algicella marina]|uniref:L-serine dehydratase n=1 Tax=Algicella marina TaxID=2683284 RepID=A0A6P1T6K7_9RHOB|nr:L-serine ammonia-lyase [Algicella marina]QHQ37320.1 L-serine ammonia-lyase [Algicella marina]